MCSIGAKTTEASLLLVHLLRLTTIVYNSIRDILLTQYTHIYHSGFLRSFATANSKST